MQLVATGEAGGADAIYGSGFEGTAQAWSGLSWVHKPEPKPEGLWIMC